MAGAPRNRKSAFYVDILDTTTALRILSSMGGGGGGRVGRRIEQAETKNFRVYSEFLSLFNLYNRLLADFLRHFGKWIELIKGAGFFHSAGQSKEG